MKKLILTAFLSLSMILSMTAQVNDSTQIKGKAKTGEQAKTQNATHGQTVSTVAKETPSGPRKGEIVSATAKTNGVAEKTENQNKKDLKDQAKDNRTAKEKINNLKGTKGARPATTGNLAPKSGIKGVNPGKR